jgi:hypothetical protein
MSDLEHWIGLAKVPFQELLRQLMVKKAALATGIQGIKEFEVTLELTKQMLECMETGGLNSTTFPATA